MSGGEEQEKRLNSALSSAAKGWPVFPLEPGKKTPAIKGWQDAATTDPDIIRRIWAKGDFNVGVKTGDGLVVLDIDVKNGKPGLASFKALALSHEAVDTFRVKTASGGWHVYWSGVAGNSVDRLGAGLDVRGAGGYVVGPGSVLTNGSGSGSYDIAHDTDALAELPEELRRLLGEPREPREQRSSIPLVELDRDDAVTRAIRFLSAEAPVAVQGEGGDLATYKVAAVLKDYGLSRETATNLMLDHWLHRCGFTWPVAEAASWVKEKIDNAYSYGLNPPGSDHPVAVFAGVRAPESKPERRAASPWFRHGDVWDRNVGWLYHEALPSVGVAVIVGAPQAGKTFVEIELSRSLATGRPFFGLVPDNPGGTVFLFAGTEGSALPLRLAALGEDRRLPISATSVSNLAERGALGKLLVLLREESARMLETFGVPLRLVILETLSASGLLTQEDNNAEAAQAMANLGTLARELGVLFLTAHHPPKGGNGPRGASAILGSTDYVMEIVREGTDSLRQLELIKARDAEQRQLGTFTLLKTDLGQDDRGRPITSMTVSMGEAIVKTGRKSQYADVFMKALEFGIMDEPSPPEGHKAAGWGLVRDHFRDLKTGSKNHSNVDAAFKRCEKYAEDIGAIGSGIYAGERYLWLKETSLE